jgi:hypothetical protein
MKEKRRCAHCGEKSLTNPRAIYCSKSCKTLAWMDRKKQEQGKNLAGIEVNESATGITKEPVRFIPQLQQEPICKPKLESTDFLTENFSIPEAEQKPQQQNTGSERKNISSIDQEIFSQSDYDELTSNLTDNKTQPFNLNNNQNAGYKQKNPTQKNNLPLDQQMAFELSGEMDYDDLFFKKSHKHNEQLINEPQNPNFIPAISNDVTGWQPQLFTEPEPPTVITVYDTRKVKKHTVQGEKAVKDATENLGGLRRIHYEDSILRTLYNTLSQKGSSVLRAWNRLPEEKRLSLVEVWSKRNTLDSLLTDGTGHDLEGHISFDLCSATAQENATQRNRIKNRVAEYAKEWESRLKKAQEFSKLITAQSSWVWVEENYIVNKDECDLYEKNCQAWRERKKNHDEKQIRERKEYIKQQEKIQQLQDVPQTKQTPLSEQSNNPITDITEGQNSVKQEGLKQLEQSNPIVPLKKSFPIRNSVKKSTIGLIVNSRDVHQYAGEMLQLSGRHGKFIGNPPSRFMAIVHGQPGAGKSTYSSQVGKYFADTCGLVIYVSGEEGLNATLEARLLRTDGKSDNLYFVDCRCLEDIFEHVKKNVYKFIIIDSLKHLGIDYAGLLDLKNHYENESIIFIQQSTKDGKMAGEQALKHEIDIEIIVKGGYAEIGKTRADNSRTGSMFDIFPEEKRTPPDEDVEVI